MVWKSLLFFIIWGVLLAPLILSFAGKLQDANRESTITSRIYFEVASVLTILVAAWVMVRLIDRRSFKTLGFSFDHFARDFFIGIGIGVLWIFLSLITLLLFGIATLKPTNSIEWFTLAMSGIALLLNTITQEVLSRSYVFQTIQSQTNTIVAIILSAVLFLLYHAGSLKEAWVAAINVFGAGILFGVAYHLTRNLWLPIAIHFTWNFLLGPVSGLTVSGQNLANNWRLFALQGPSLLTGGTFGAEGSLIVTLMIALIIVVLILVYKKLVLLPE